MKFGTIFTLYVRNLKQYRRLPAVLAFSFIVPVIQYLIFSNLFNSLADVPGNPYGEYPYYLYITPAIILLTAIFGSINSSAALLVDLNTGYFDKLRATPASLVPQIIARFMSEFTRLSLQLTLIITVSILYHKRISGILELPEAGITGLILIVLLSAGFGIGVVGNLVVALAFKTKSDQAVQAVFPLFFLAVFMSTAYVPEALLPDWLQSAVGYNPGEYMVQAIRGIFLEGFVDSTIDAIYTAFGCIVVLTALTGYMNFKVISSSID
tara:strand:+ start:1640 stop:2440 length:801 start_codon:yes stop_codon:yes gene_type:complete